MSTRVAPVVALTLVVLLGGVAPVVGGGSDAAFDRAEDATVHRTGDEIVYRTGDALAQYKISLDNVTVRTWLLRNSTVLNATVKTVVVRNVTTVDGTRENVTLTNVTVGKFVLERGRLKNVTARTLIVRNKSVLNVPGGSFFDPDVENKTIDRQWTKNATVSGVVIDKITIDAAILCENVTLGQRANASASFGPKAGGSKPDVTVKNGTVGEALIIEGGVFNWSVGSVEQPKAANASLPQSCERGQDGQGDGNDDGGGDGQG